MKKFLESLCYGAGEILKKKFRKTVKISRKPDTSIVTESDKAAEAFILKSIFKKYPTHSVLSEESGKFDKDKGALWVIDPLDGTTNFAHGFPWFCVSIGFLEDGVIRYAGIFNPISEEFFYSEKGKGAFRNGKKIKVSKTDNLQDALIGTGFYYTRGEELTKEMSIFARVNEKARGVRRPGSAALDLAYVACGSYDAFWERRLSPWDVAAGFLLVQEAGGKLTNYHGKPTGIYEGSCVASNPYVFEELISIITPS